MRRGLRRKRISGEEDHAKTQRARRDAKGKKGEKRGNISDPFFFLGDLCTFAPLREVFSREFFWLDHYEDVYYTYYSERKMLQFEWDQEKDQDNFKIRRAI